MDTAERARALHERTAIIDCHADTVVRFLESPEGFFGAAREGHLDARRLREARQNVQVMAVFTPPEQADLAALQFALDCIHAYNAILESPSNAALRPPFRPILGGGDLAAACRPGACGFLLFLEGASPLRGSLRNLDLFHRLGVRGITLTHNHDNEAARGCFAEGSGRGLTGFGRELVAEMDRRGMVVDLAHSNEDLFWDVMAAARRPLIDSHTGVRAIADVPRNLSDEQLDAVASTGGVVCIDFYPGHLMAPRPEPRAPLGIDSVVRSVAHAAERVGVDHVGLGSDWDGIEETVAGLEDCSRLPAFTAALLEAGFGDADVAKILGGNLRRALGACMA
jgi:membrane dipeptidase